MSLKWFQDICGYDEETWKKTIQPQLNVQPKDKFLIINPKTNKTFDTGYFYISTIQSLIEELTLIETVDESKSPGIPFTILKPSKDNPLQVDIRYLQAQPENNQCMFQIASNFNALETSSTIDFPDNPFFTTKYASEPTQGTFASASAGPGAIKRTYFAIEDKKFNRLSPQTKNLQLNLLGNLKDYFQVYNGKVVSWKKQINKNLMYKMMVAIHENIQVSHTIDKDSRWTIIDHPQFIHQVFCSTIPLGRYNILLKDDITALCLLLEGAYNSAYLAAHKTQSKKLFLTLIGGGVFYNPIELILKSILKVHRQWKTRGLNIGEVCLVIYDPLVAFENQDLEAFEKEINQ